MALSEHQLRTLSIVERCASALSILGVATIIGIFCFSRQFRNPIHRIVFVNAFYNLFDAVGTTIALSGPGAGNHSALCQCQSFLIQMFPLADVFWTLAMAIDVFLIVFYQYDAGHLRKLEMKYIAIITAITFIPAFTFFLIRTPERGPMYGSVTIWCSIAPNWVLFRIVFFYGPIWLVIFIVMILYALVGIEIVKQKRVSKEIGREYITLDTIVSAPDFSSNNAEINTITVNNPSSMAKPPNRTVTESASSSNPTSQLHGAPQRPRVSFGQYILLPLMFFVVLLAIWVAPTTNRVLAFVNPSYESYPLLLAVVSTGSLRGFWNAVVFVALGMKERRRTKRWRMNIGRLR